MTGNRFLRRPGMLASEPKLGRMLAASFTLHLVVVLIFAGVLLPRSRQDRRPVYIVDLVNLPVANPQAGRPDATPKQPKVKPKPTPEPEVTPKPVAKTTPKPVVKPTPKLTPTSKPKPVKPVVKAAPQADYQVAVSAIEKLKREKAIADLKQTLVGLQAEDTRKAEVKAPLGEVIGTGNQAGVVVQTWLQEYYKQAWSLSKYQVSRLDLETTVRVVFDARGYLKDYRILQDSGDRRFDDSVTQAIRSLERLLPEPGQTVEYTIHFNLKDLIER